MIDDEILNLGIREKRVIITEDKDFGERIFKNKIPCYGLILIRVKSKSRISLDKRISIFFELLQFNIDKIINNFTVISETKYRIKEL